MANFNAKPCGLVTGIAGGSPWSESEEVLETCKPELSSVLEKFSFRIPSSLELLEAELDYGFLAAFLLFINVSISAICSAVLPSSPFASVDNPNPPIDSFGI
jgi:hypothetical protein